MNLREEWRNECQLDSNAPTLRDVIMHNWNWFQNQQELFEKAVEIPYTEANRLWFRGAKILKEDGTVVTDHWQITKKGKYFYPDQEPYQREN